MRTTVSESTKNPLSTNQRSVKDQIVKLVQSDSFSADAYSTSPGNEPKMTFMESSECTHTTVVCLPVSLTKLLINLFVYRVFESDSVEKAPENILL